jgi:hypothetical protein
MMIQQAEVHDIASTWIKFTLSARYSESYEATFWAFKRLNELISDVPHDAWQVINAIRHFDQSDKIAANLEAGPLEDLLVKHGDEFIGIYEELGKNDEQFRMLLGGVWQNEMSDQIWQRLKAVAGPSW